MRHLLLVALLIIVLGIVSIATIPNRAQSQDASLNWIHPAIDLQNTNFSPQTVITKDNINALELRWIYQVPEDPFKIPFVAPSLGLQTPPLLVSGIAYITPFYNRVIALNAESGAEVWRYQVNVTEFLDEEWWWPVLSQKGLNYHEGVIYMMASDCRIIGLDAVNGEELFVIRDVCKDVPGNTGFYFGEHAPLIFDDLIIARASTQDGGGRGFVVAYDLNSHDEVWRWFSAPPAGGDPEWDFADAHKGNIDPFRGDWGDTDLIGGAAIWSLIAVDEDTRIIYFATGSVPGVFDAALRPGPNLYASSIVALNADTGDMVWYYAIAPHDINDHETGWSVILADANIGNERRKVIIAGSKTDYLYVLDAANGEPVYDPLKLGQPSFNVPNDNAGNNADLTISQRTLVGKIFCPGGNGGMEHPPAFADNTIYVATQRVCWTLVEGPVNYKGKDIDGFIYGASTGERQNSTLYAIDVSDGSIKWTFEMPNRYQSAGITVSGGVVYAVDRASVWYALDQETGTMLRRSQFGGLGAGTVTLGATARGEMMLFLPAGGGQVAANTPGILVAFGLPEGVSGNSGPNIVGSPTELVSIAVAATAAIVAVVVVLRSRRR